MTVTVLADNIGTETLCGEWGLSLYIEHAGHTLLLDAGASGLFCENAAALGLDLAAVEYGVLSHAHYDHADGMEDFFARNEKARFYLRKGARENCFGYHGESLDYIGIRHGTLARFADRIEYVSGLYELYPGAWLLGHTTPGLAEAGRRAELYVVDGADRRPDDFSHEQSLVLEEDGGLAVLSSCSHAGVETILREVRAAFPGKTVRALIGGFHLYKTAPEDVRRLGRALRADGVETIVTGHCTGQEAFDLLREELGEAVHQMRVGLVIGSGLTVSP